MHIVGILNTKGGTAKSTLSACLAVRAAQDKNVHVGVVDLDPQSSYSEWFKRYSARRDKRNIDLLLGEDRASDAIEKLQLTSDYDYVFLDGPPGAKEVTGDAIDVSTFVIIPMRASTIDLSASQHCIDLCEELGTPYMVVITLKGRYDQKFVDEARSLLFSWKIPIADTVIAQRTAYINAWTTGRTGPEKDKAAAKEIDALWHEIKAALRVARKLRAA